MSATATELGRHAQVPSVRAWRKRARRARREHHSRSLGDILTDLYTLLWFLLIYGTALVSEVRRHLSTAAAAEVAAARHWLGVSVLLATAGLAWRGLRAAGPMIATSPEQPWAVSTPMDRRKWLLPRFAGMVLMGATVGAVASAVVALLGASSGGVPDPLLAGLAGGLLGAALPAGVVVAQAAPREQRPRWSAAGSALLGAAGLLAVLVVAGHYSPRAIPAPPTGAGPPVILASAALALASLRWGWRALSRLDRSRIGSGAALVGAVVSSVLWLDPAVLGRLLEQRRWRAVGRVPSRAPHAGIPLLSNRLWGLLRMEIARLARRRGALALAAALVLVQYAVAVVAPAVADVVRIVLAYVVAGRFMGGLRALARAPALRRALGGSEPELRLPHVVLPALVTALWWLATIAAGPGDPGVAGFLLALGTVVAAYRSATAGQRTYDGAVIETPFGLLPLGLLLQISRGPDLLGAVILVDVLFLVGAAR